MAFSRPVDGADWRRTGTPRRHPTECTFFYHAHANVAEPFVSHCAWESAARMLAAAAQNTRWGAEASAAASAHDSPLASGDTSSAMTAPATAEPSRVSAVAAAAGGSGIQQSGTIHHVTTHDSSALTELMSQSGTAPQADTTATTVESDSRSTALPPPSQTPASPPPPCLPWPVPRHAGDSALVRRQRALLGHRLVMAKLVPLLLPCGAYSSVFASHVEYTQLTCCYRALGLPCARVGAVWLSLMRAALLCLLHGDAADSEARLTVLGLDIGLPNLVAARGRDGGLGSLCSVVTGAYVHRVCADAFEVAVVMGGGSTDGRHLAMQQCFSRWCGVDFLSPRTALPIGAALRCVSLRLRWTPQHRRVTPGALLPPIVAYVRSEATPRPPHRRRLRRGAARYSECGRDAATSAAARTAAEVAAPPPFLAYDAVRLFLARPVTSQLHGTLVRRLPDVSPWSDASEQPANADKEHDDAGKSPPPLQPCDEAGSGAGRAVRPQPLLGAPDVVRLQDGTTQVVCEFADVSVTAVGEHLVASEMRPTAAYFPFVPTLCANVSPFLVVSPDEA